MFEDKKEMRVSLEIEFRISMKIMGVVKELVVQIGGSRKMEWVFCHISVSLKNPIRNSF